jgi:polyphenol oxidase
MITNPFSILAPYEDRLRVSLFTKEDEPRNDQQIAELLGANHAVALHQVHGSKVIVAREEIARTIQADGVVTDMPNLALTIRSADCQNFVVFAPEKNVVGALHVGWKGLIADAIPSFFALLLYEWRIQPQEVLVGAGPSLCTTCADFTNPAIELPTVDSTFFSRRCIDLQGAANTELHSLGVPPDQIERMRECTRCNPEKYWTYRGGDKEKVLAGRTNLLACALTGNSSIS